MKYVRPEIAAMGGYVPGEQPQEGQAVKMNTNENPYRASEKVFDAIRNVAAKGLSRYPNSLGEPFREAAAKVYHVDPNWILCGNGSDDILTILTRTFVGSGELLRLPYPSYILYKSLAEIQGAQSEEVRFNDDWTLPPYFGESPRSNFPGSYYSNPDAQNHRLGLVYLPNPNSPSGTIIPQEQIAKMADSLPCPLLIDEAYADFAGSNCIDLVKNNPKIMISRTMSKSYALAGLRFGFLIAQPEMIEQLIKVKDSYNCDSLAIAAATAAMNDQDWLLENRKKLLAGREKLTQKMRNLGFIVPDSFANFTWNVHSNPNVSHKSIYDFLKQNKILVRYMNYVHWGDGLRISVGTDEQIDQCLNLIEFYLNQNERSKK
ncbi:MAG: aminotransferase class I/II-fold pyridoxal phosphate-dependent enzyme [Planctomycetia bacterium]|nr:aminotransferase class I/II-fold pyridoxal phosphate-dependent enzyme [Planctomycetia bacterium]